ncbi:MAG: hypothetical protein COZ21_08685 [Bacteroidetes bacterium CG_4_10_14_3_um_filter_31_20]|nr:DUF2752 domain-containing protein [Bacteroidota bacterium]PIX33088.1 MAG: hypothetical protein COZ59_10575 [Bacteroidetes bacterium CG_4_8_14_3_um_filter_31_14]PIY03639.1 MAG: hypothetical protein COZ21_08685 [Bacteroidetes bacterium CG_4_10_14_3_um_filter_31_20]
MKISLYTDFVDWLESHTGSCFYKNIFGVECPGCGMQRSIIELLKGNFVESFLLYPALYPLIFTLILLFLHIIFRFKNGALILKISFIFTVLIMIISYIIKIINK